eukprot:gb/GECG01007485.1/.p1 GENE.gb/GECG01007485.1/~~gb/GECG01007485.1/.p1  ORF type:complete len:423 (+),score=23.40 gb/GECG01007485.1/:1-1269(+)
MPIEEPLEIDTSTSTARRMASSDRSTEGFAVNAGFTRVKPSRSAYNWSKGLLGATLVVVAGILPVIIWQLVKLHAERHVIAWFIGGVCVCIAVPISVHDMVGHWLHYSYPDIQVYYVRVLGMVPIYSIESWFALRFKESAFYLEALRDTYEAYVIYNFFMILIRLVGTDREVKRALRRQRNPRDDNTLLDEDSSPNTDDRPNSHRSYAKHMVPMCCLPRWKLGNQFYFNTQVGVFQYVVVKLITTATTLITTKLGVYGDGEFHSFDRAYIYVTVLVNFSQMWAVYNLVLFYHTLSSSYKGRGVSPIGKMVCIKGIVFFTFWQQILIAGLVFEGIITGTRLFTTEEVADGLQDFIITFEMVFFAIAHHFYFSYKDFEHASGETRKGFFKAVGQGVFPRDIMTHSRDMMFKKRRRSSDELSNES